jgi:predicted phosphodiesterase
MKVAVCSDLHLEFGPISLENTENADVLILSGDILVEASLRFIDDPMPTQMAISNKYHTFMQECSERFPHVIYIAGNHEHYHGDFGHTIRNLRDKFAYLDNVHILDKTTFKLNEYVFVGGTLWTDMNNEDPITLHAMKSMMNDFRLVMNNKHNQPVKFLPEDAVEDHRMMMDFIRVCIECLPTHKFVVVGHHAPSRLSTHPRYKDEQVMNGGYSSELSEFILDHPQIKLWTHGHTHEPFDYMIGDTRIVCNPRGYINYEGCADNFKLQFIEV